MKSTNFGKPLSQLITMVAICMLSFHAMAYDFSYNYQGNTLYYNITSDNTVEVTYYSSTTTDNNYVSGDVVIPSSVTNNGTTYSVTSIGDAAFSDCSGLTSVTIPNSVTSIGERAFASCSGLISVTIPNSITSIGDYAFYLCRGLTSVTIPNSVTSIADYAFWGCSGLTSVTIPNSVTSIGEWAFSYCISLTSVTIPNSVTSIGGGVFEGCSGLTSITIPNSVTSIGEWAFWGCSGLTSIVSNAVVPPAIGIEVFPYPNTCNVTVPCGSLEAYIASLWNGYFPSRIEEDCSSALQEVESTREFVVYPNPTSGKVVFDKAVERVEVIDLVGKTIQTYENASEINIGALPAGVYHLRMSLEDQTITRMVIKE
ncbi:MAG: leucine-rich repeat domain-containing protein [Candidatus Onthomorpha sp.]